MPFGFGKAVQPRCIQYVRSQSNYVHEKNGRPSVINGSQREKLIQSGSFMQPHIMYNVLGLYNQEVYGDFAIR